MVIKKLYLFTIFFLISGLLVINSSGFTIEVQPSYDIPPNKLNTSNYEYICKVFTFSKTQNTSILMYNLPRTYIYSIIIQVVTPHSCTMNITLWDPSDQEYQIFYASISQASGEINTEFGTAESGNFTFQFLVATNTNLNIKITIQNTGILALFDKIPADEQRRMIFYEVTSFSNGYFIQHEISLLSDQRYKFYIGRVSSISMALSNIGIVSYTITDPTGRIFHIYSNVSLAGIADVNIFTFGTAIAGTYTIDIEIYCDVPWMNVAYTIINDGRICDPPPDSNNTSVDNFFWIPIEWGLLTVIGVGAIVGAVVIIVLVTKKKGRIEIKKRD